MAGLHFEPNGVVDGSSAQAVRGVFVRLLDEGDVAQRDNDVDETLNREE